MTIKIRPVSKSYFGKTTVSIREVALKRKAGTVVIADRLNPDNTTTRVLLIPEGSSTKPKVGEILEARNLQNDRKYGGHFVLDVVQFCFKSGVLMLKDLKPATIAYADVVDAEGVAFELC